MSLFIRSLIVSLLLEMLGGCGLSTAQRAATARFGAATADLGAIAATAEGAGSAGEGVTGAVAFPHPLNAQRRRFLATEGSATLWTSDGACC